VFAIENTARAIAAQKPLFTLVRIGRETLSYQSFPVPPFPEREFLQRIRSQVLRQLAHRSD